MARCRYCERSGLTVRTNQRGICRACGKAIQQDVEMRLAEVKEALVYIRCSKSPEVQKSFCDVAMQTVAKLAGYEKRRLAEIRPSPAALLAMLRSKKLEAGSALAGKTEVVRPLAGGTAYLSHISEPVREAADGLDPAPGAAFEEAGQLGSRLRLPGRQGEGEWWAWDPSPPEPEGATGPTDGGPADARDEGRLQVDCLALLDPGAIRGTLQNISPGGLFLQADTLHAPGQSVRLIVSTAHGPAKAQGVVRWVRTDTLSDEPAGMGIEFTGVTEELRSFLSARLGCTLPVAGARAPSRSRHGPVSLR